MKRFQQGKLYMPVTTVIGCKKALRRRLTMGKKNRARVNSPKKNNHVPKEAIIAEQEAHGKEFSATGGRKNN